MQPKQVDVESLLQRDRRARLPLPRQFVLYLDPFSLFKDASSGSRPVRERALSYNRTMRWVLLTYIRRWVMIAATSFLGIAPAEAMAAQKAVSILPAAALAVGCCIAFTVTIATVAVYFLLGIRRD